jgi:hypothetical protein
VTGQCLHLVYARLELLALHVLLLLAFEIVEKGFAKVFGHVFGVAFVRVDSPFSLAKQAEFLGLCFVV